MDNKKKAGIAIGLGVAAIGIGAAVAAQKKEEIPPLPPGEGGAGITIEILDAEGNPVPHNSPATLTEGASYSVKLTVTNTSTKGGVPCEATLSLDVYIGTSAVTFAYPPITAFAFGAGATRVIDYTLLPIAFNVPMGTGGQAGNIIARVLSPAGVELAKAIEYFTITALPIIYGATIVIGV